MATALEIKPNTAINNSVVNPAHRNKKVGFFERCMTHVKAKKRVNKIMRSLHEAKEIHAGKRKGQSFEAFLENF